ncbi:helicase IV [Paraliobacillus quinghaiensis]|uniref:Helicase IV n=1 Tax=Paraliobacillus quinghaiensis TaxID=470815 RepID=A0A917TR32_9BACI|nr:RNA polymerase recycling motor HelD [Paraliobacillus quinghaiensis]GGM33509.1 helicase IV [Paraliobacillus quinghaiensis]
MGEYEEDLAKEQERVNLVVKLIKQKINKISTHVKTIKDRVIDIRKNFWEDVTVNLEEMDDVIETQASLKQQAEFLSERERSHGQLSKQLDTLERLKDSPYFGRIDFMEEGEKEASSIYIGIASLMDEQEEDFLIYDWRAPISSLYYDYPPGKASYQAIDEQIDGEITLKRQYIIRQGTLKGMFNTGLTIGDHLLQSVLGDNADTKMKSIVATIQQEQNQIIRNEKSRILVVQGVAGSGKTSAALQRVAYLLYRYREHLKSENIVLFSPNSLFNSYVATVLPELGEDNMKQTTFYRYIDTQLGDQFAIESPFDQMEYYLQVNDHQSDSRVEAMRYKASLHFKEQIDQFLTTLIEEGMTFRNVRFRGKLIVSKKEIHDYFYKLKGNLSIPLRLEKVVHWLLEKIDQLEEIEREKDWVLEETELLDKADYLEVHQQLEDETPFEEDVFIDSTKEEELLRNKVIKKRLRPLRKKIKRFYFTDVKNTYIQLFEASHQQQSDLLPQNWQEICELTSQSLKANFLTWEDATPYLYFEKILLGFQANRSIQHVFIDEAQDYSAFQFVYLQKMFPSSRMTLLGDINQAIYIHALEEDNVLADSAEEKHEKITLTRSYRSTKPIVEFTSSWMPNGDKIEAFNREGVLPVVMEVDNTSIAADKLVYKINDYQAAEHQTIAVICKTMQESEQVSKRLSQEFDVTLMGPNAHTYQKGIIVIPAYLAKGIEFDAVIIYNASHKRYQNELERNLLYTACTRAMHELFVLSIGEVSTFIEQVPKNRFTHYKIHEFQKNQR